MQKYYVKVWNAEERRAPSTEWFKDSNCTILHRIGGPAVEWTTSDYTWFVDSERHRTDGPAVEPAPGPGNGRNEWWLDGVKMTKKEHTRCTAPVQEMTVAEIEAAFGHKVKVIK